MADRRSIPRPDDPPWYTGRVELVLYVLAAISYCVAAIFHKFLLTWIIGPLWLVAWIVLVPMLVERIRSTAGLDSLTRVCVNCISNAEAVLAGAGLVGAIVQPPLHRALAAAGLVDAPDPVKRDVRTVTFLRQLDLDPVAVLGADVVAAAEAWAPQVRPARRRSSSALPIGSHSLLATQ